MAEPARKINNDENRGIIKNGEADGYQKDRRLKLVPNKEKEKESEISGQLRQRKKAEADIRKEPVNLDDYRPQNRQIRQEQPQQSAPALDLNERLKQRQTEQAGGGGEEQIQSQNPFQGGEGLDARLMNRPNVPESGKADDYDKEDGDKESGEQGKDPSASSGQAKKKKTPSEEAAEMNADKQKKRSLKQKAGQKVVSSVEKMFGQGPKKMLRWAWVNSLETFGLSIIIYVNIHVFCRWVFGEEFFCKLGDEWDELDGGLSMASDEQSGEKQNTKKKWAGLAELLVLVILDAIVLIVIGIFLTFIVMIVQFMEASLWDKVKAIWGVLKEGSDVVWAGVQALYDLFKGLL